MYYILYRNKNLDEGWNVFPIASNTMDNLSVNVFTMRRDHPAWEFLIVREAERIPSVVETDGGYKI